MFRRMYVFIRELSLCVLLSYIKIYMQSGPKNCIQSLHFIVQVKVYTFLGATL
jgi:hypothetical protein